jgi:hypothetical protein
VLTWFIIRPSLRVDGGLGDEQLDDDEDDDDDLDRTAEDAGDDPLDSASDDDTDEDELAMMKDASEEGEIDGEVADSFLADRSRRLLLPPPKNLLRSPDDPTWLPQRRIDASSPTPAPSTSPNSSLELVRAYTRSARSDAESE